MRVAHCCVLPVLIAMDGVAWLPYLGYALARDEPARLSGPPMVSSVHPCSSSLGILRTNELTHLIFFSRLALFTTCRKFTDKSLYNELKQISQLPLVEVPVELDTLPSPSVTSKRRSRNDTLHSLLSWTSSPFASLEVTRSSSS